jgi:4-amino-4-deoxy-L-arabinose transferase-like glycosyltransferase
LTWLKSREAVFLISIIIIAAVLRFWQLGDIGFNSDEAVYSGQAATLAGYQSFASYFSIFRAHPLFFQFIVSMVYQISGVSDIAPRVISASFGIATVYVTYLIGNLLYNKKVGLISALIIAMLPYHVIVTRQAMVDVPFSFFFALTLLFVSKYVLSDRYLPGIRVKHFKSQRGQGKLEILNFRRMIFYKKLQRTTNHKDNKPKIPIFNDSYVSKSHKDNKPKIPIFNDSYVSKSHKDNKPKIPVLSDNTIAGSKLWLYAIGASCGFVFLSKEVGILALIASLFYLIAVHKIGIRAILIISLTFAVTVSPHFMLLLIKNEAAQNAFLYSQWQLNRPPNHSYFFYPLILVGSLGPILLGLSILSLVGIFRAKIVKRPEVLLLIWISIPLLFFQLWPTKGFYYILPTIPVFAILGSSFLFSRWLEKLRDYKIIIILLIALIPLTTNQVISVMFPFLGGDMKYLAGSGGLPLGRETALWIKENTPEGSVFMTIGPTMGNLIKFYANSQALAISTNPNPAKHNPSYSPITNPDLMIRNGQIHYIVYDIYSAARTQHFADKLLYYVDKYNGQLIHSESTSYSDNEGNTVTKPVTQVYVINNIRGAGIK